MWAWLFTSVVELFVLEVIMCTAVDLQPGPPLDDMCGAEYKEFSLPRFRGYIYWEYTQIVIVTLWFHGCMRRPAGAPECAVAC